MLNRDETVTIPQKPLHAARVEVEWIRNHLLYIYSYVHRNVLRKFVVHKV